MSETIKVSGAWRVSFDDDPKGGLLCEVLGRGSVVQRGSQWRLHLEDGSRDEYRPRDTTTLLDALVEVQRRARIRLSSPKPGTIAETIAKWLEKSGKTFIPLPAFADSDRKLMAALKKDQVSHSWKIKLGQTGRNGLFAQLSHKVDLEQRGGQWNIVTTTGSQLRWIAREDCSLVNALIQAQEAAGYKVRRQTAHADSRPTSLVSTAQFQAIPANNMSLKVPTHAVSLSDSSAIDGAWIVSFDPSPSGGIVVILSGHGTVDLFGGRWRFLRTNQLEAIYFDVERWPLAEVLHHIQNTFQIDGPTARKSKSLLELREWLKNDGLMPLAVGTLVKGKHGLALRPNRLDPRWTVRFVPNIKSTVAQLGTALAVVHREGTCFYVRLEDPLTVTRCTEESLIATMARVQAEDVAGSVRNRTNHLPVGILPSVIDDRRLSLAIAKAAVTAKRKIGARQITSAVANTYSGHADGIGSAGGEIARVLASHKPEPVAPPVPLPSPTRRGRRKRMSRNKGRIIPGSGVTV